MRHSLHCFSIHWFQENCKRETKKSKMVWVGRRGVLLLLAVAIVARYDRVLAFQQKISVPGKTTLAGLDLRKDTISLMVPELGSDGGDDADYSREMFSRRNAVSGALSLATMATLWPLKEALASPDEESTTTTNQKPFRVLFTIQIDSQKPEDLSELEVEVRPDWAPIAAERFRDLVELGFYTNAPFFRVLPGYVAQFGVSSDPKLNKQWMYCDTTDEEAKRNCKPGLPDESRTQPNKKGTLSFASSGKNSRRTQIFINLANNDGPPNFLDAQNFVPFARIVRGMEPENNIPKRLNGEYGGKVNQGKAAYYGGKYFEAVFPKLSVIRDAKIM